MVRVRFPTFPVFKLPPQSRNLIIFSLLLQVYQKLSKRDQARKQLASFLEDQYEKANITTRWSPIDFEALKDSQKLLRRNILQNVWCTSEIYYNMFRTLYTDTERRSSADTLHQDMCAIIRLRYLHSGSSAIGRRLTEYCPKSMRKRHLGGKFEHPVPAANQKNNLNIDNSDMVFSVRVKSRLLRDCVMKYLVNQNNSGELCYIVYQA